MKKQTPPPAPPIHVKGASWTRWLPLLLTAVSLCAIACCLLCFESELLWKAQELNLFLDTPLFLKQQMVTSGWLLTWLGTFFTEFFYHPWMGVSMLCGWWALLMYITAKAFKVPLRWTVVLLVPVVLLLITCVDMGYWVFYLKLRGHFFAATIGSTMAVAAVWIYRVLSERRPVVGIALIGVAAVVLYPLIGFYGLLAVLLMGLTALRADGYGRAWKVALPLVALLCIAIVPQVYYRYVFYETNQINIYWTGLPLYVLSEEWKAYYIPYYILVAYFVALALLRGVWGGERKVILPVISQVVVVAALVFATWHFWYKDYNFHKELRMQRCVENLDWEGVLAEAADAPEEPNRAIVMMKNLALFRLGRQGDEMYHYRTGAKPCNTPIDVRMIQVIGRLIYYNYGQLNYCYRWCLEDGVEYGWRAEYLKYLVRCSLLNGEYRVAAKYIALLKHTRYHRQWAENYEKYINNPEAVSKAEEFAPITHLMGSNDMLASDNALIEYYLMNSLVNTYTEDPLFQELTLLAALWLKDIDAFWPHFFNYARLHPTIHMPVHYQEAAYLYGHLENKVDISNMPFDPSVVQSYNDFMALANQCGGMSEESMKPLFWPRFGKTFYYEYFLIRNQKMY